MSKSQERKGKSKPKKVSYKKENSKYSKNKSAVQENQPKTKHSNQIRLNKYIANSGICSRRDADMHITTGLVRVNGKVITEMGYKVNRNDDVRFDGVRVQPEKPTYVLLNKPKGFATTTSQNKGRTVMDLVANATPANIKPIGRLGRNSTGLLLFTNDDTIVQKFTNSKRGVARLFHVELNQNLKQEDFIKIQEGFTVNGKKVEVEEISYIEGASKKEVGVKIKNTGNTILRTIFDTLGYTIMKLDCVAIAHLTKKDVPRGHWKILTQPEINALKML